MSAPTTIIDPKTGNVCRVTRFGQLAVAPLDYSTPVERSLLIPLEVVNFIAPEQNQQIVITDIIASADKDVSNVDPADIVIYEAESATTSTSVANIVSPQLIRAANVALTGLNLLIPEGLWVNATTTDGGILLTIMFYRVPIKES